MIIETKAPIAIDDLKKHFTDKETFYLIDYKITSQPIRLGNIYAKRDWGHAKDFVDGMWRILQFEKPEDFVLSTGKQYSVKEFIQMISKIGRLSLDQP